jgi:hypothetical protein
LRRLSLHNLKPRLEKSIASRHFGEVKLACPKRLRVKQSSPSTLSIKGGLKGFKLNITVIKTKKLQKSNRKLPIGEAK